MERRLVVLAASALIVAAVLGSAWITGQFTTPAVDRAHGYVSELAARDQPWTRLFRVSDGLAGLACVSGVLLLPRAAREWPGWLAVAAFGLFTFASGVFPLDCAALSDPACGLREPSWSHRVHSLAAALSTVFGLAAMVLLGARWRSWVSWLLTWLSVAATLLTVGALAAGQGVGIAHRAQLAMFAVWLVYAALHLLVSDDHQAPVPDLIPAPVTRAREGRPATARTHAAPSPAPGIAARVPSDGDLGEVLAAGPGMALNAGPGVALGAVAGAPPGMRAPGRRPDFGAVDGYGPPHVVEQGTGPAVLITAGAAGAWFHWDAVAAELVRRHRVIRFDRPGLGLSPRSPAPPTLYAEVARLAALAPAHPERVTVVAHGVACWHAEAFARLHPLCVAGLVLVAPACARERRPLALARSAGRWLPALGGTWGATALARLIGPPAHRLFAGCSDPAGVYSMGKVPAAVVGEWLARRDMAADLHRLRQEKPVPGVAVTVISTGERDACQERLARDLAAELVRLPAVGRQVPLEAPEAIVDAVSGVR
ncbi:alpha/beta fold hydrolase [Nonomuraea deserti]|uniref:Alpha/beta fold hydrolase n=1 Tax=Nonomuraea deserti TaxID=1848322 RepID=A0A4R4VM79_9ACTN|nr:alpha/beta fold hydrolase [Nonomuraea deserti]TDD06752.1 alpha/beta fold hydrolase [Nonomuraea deserti]